MNQGRHQPVLRQRCHDDARSTRSDLLLGPVSAEAGCAPVGAFRARCFSSTLAERRHLVFEKVRWFGGDCALKDAPDEAPLAEADRAGILSLKWRLHLSSGPAEMRLGGWIWARRPVSRDGAEIAFFRYFPLCPGRWVVEGDPTLTPIDLLLIGRVAHTALGLYSA